MSKMGVIGGLAFAFAVMIDVPVRAERFQFIGCSECITGQTLKIKGPKGKGAFQFKDDFGFRREGVAESRLPTVEYFGSKAILRAAGPNGDRFAVVDFVSVSKPMLVLDLKVVETILAEDLSWGAARLSSENRYLPAKKILYFDLDGSIKKEMVFERSISARDEKSYAHRDSDAEDPERVFGLTAMPNKRSFFFIDSVKNRNTLFVVSITNRGTVISKYPIFGSFKGGIKGKKWLNENECEFEDREGKRVKIGLPR